MNDNSSSSDNTPNLAPVIGFALGALVGGTLALLFAPASGAKTRRRLGEAARQMGRDAGHSLDDTRHTLEDARERVTRAAGGLGADVQSAIKAGREAFRHDDRPADTASRPAEPANAVPTRS